MLSVLVDLTIIIIIFIITIGIITLMMMMIRLMLISLVKSDRTKVIIFAIAIAAIVSGESIPYSSERSRTVDTC